MSYLKNLGTIQIAVLFLILANIIWGAALPIYKWTLQDLPPFTFIFLRFFLSALIILPFVIKKLKVSRRDYLDIVLVGIFSVSLQIPLLFFGLKLTPSINAPIIISLEPVILMIAAVIFLKEKLSAKLISGVIISLLGVFAIILPPLLTSGFSGSFLGNILIFLAAMCAVVQALVVKRLTVRNEPLTILFWMFFVGALPLLPFVFKELQTFSLITDLTIQGMLGLIYAIYFSTILAHFFFVYGLKYIKASEVGIFSYVDPIATILVAVPLLGEQLTGAYIVGAMLVFLGIFIAEGRFHYHPIRKLIAKNLI